jgi:hypothetical protein
LEGSAEEERAIKLLMPQPALVPISAKWWGTVEHLIPPLAPEYAHRVPLDAEMEEACRIAALDENQRFT